jgi:hypothetical protein
MSHVGQSHCSDLGHQHGCVSGHGPARHGLRSACDCSVHVAVVCRSVRSLQADGHGRSHMPTLR